ncbi:hypothetical protein Taro_048713 [Colocasia esculenta]|uniref:Fucosyltransferase n=1 Tax=Colocasia esculenta TaxID=4460 RepID=A0A843X8W7_COLES|nr:hypothetical protein [Colocasia esculenta]
MIPTKNSQYWRPPRTMGTVTPGSRTEQQPSSPFPSDSFSLLGTEDCTVGGGYWGSLKKAWGSASPAVGAVSEQSRSFWSLWLVVACLSFPTLVFVSGVYRPPLAFISGVSSSVGSPTSFRHPRPTAHGTPVPVSGRPNGTVAELYSVLAPAPSPTSAKKLPDAVAAAFSPKDPTAAGPSPSFDAHDDRTLGGLLFPGFDEASCLSRYQSHAYRKASPYKPSPYLLRRLRAYEANHRRCGPHTRSYRRALRLLKPGRDGEGSPGGPCKYVVWNPENGLGNRMLSMASAFLYSLLSRRVLLVEGSTDLGGLFCDPFPGSSWLLPIDFPLRRLPFNQKYSKSYGNLLKTSRIGNSAGGTLHRPFVYAHLSNDYDEYDKRFYCEGDQLLLEKIPWLVLRSDQYFVPALFLNPEFEAELVRMFPEKVAVFHHLGRYLFHPSNEVWNLITKYYEEHLATERERVGIQIRVFAVKLRPFDLILHQILNCTLSEKLLPKLDLRRQVALATGGTSKAVLLASLHSFFYDKMKGMYSEHPAAGGEVVSFHQPSHEEVQMTGRAAHDGKALAEIYLLSMVDALVTSSWSTFGYVSQGLSGSTPWVLLGPVHKRLPEPACVRDVTPEPCFHFPPNYDCRARAHADTTKLLPYTTHCRDFWKGVKLVDGMP